MELLLPATISFIITSLVVIPTIKLAIKYNLLDDPQKRPHPAHIQKRIIPRAGGLAIFIGIFISTLWFVPIEKYVIGIILALIVLLVTGLIDDFVLNFSPYPRLLLQIIAAAIIVASGVGITFINNPLGGILRLDNIVYQVNLFGVHNIVLIADVFAFLWIVWMINMINWSKGIDGQMPSIAAIASIIIGLFSYQLFTAGDPNQLNIAILSFITTGAALAFLVFNWHPAKIIPGMSGSTILALMIATLSILSGAKLAIAILVLLVPSVDFFYTFFRRVISGKSPFFGDQKHLHHLLLKRGWSHQKIALFYTLTSAILGWIALSLNSQGKLFAGILVGTLILGVILWLNFFGDLSKQQDQDSG